MRRKPKGIQRKIAGQASSVDEKLAISMYGVLAENSELIDLYEKIRLVGMLKSKRSPRTANDAAGLLDFIPDWEAEEIETEATRAAAQLVIDAVLTGGSKNLRRMAELVEFRAQERLDVDEIGARVLRAYRYLVRNGKNATAGQIIKFLEALDRNQKTSNPPIYEEREIRRIMKSLGVFQKKGGTKS